MKNKRFLMLLACALVLQPINTPMFVQATEIESTDKKEDEKYVLELIDKFDVTAEKPDGWEKTDCFEVGCLAKKGKDYFLRISDTKVIQIIKSDKYEIIEDFRFDDESDIAYKFILLEPEIEPPLNLQAEYEQDTDSLELPKGFSVKKKQTFTSIGEQKIDVLFSPLNHYKYKCKDFTLTVNVKKAKKILEAPDYQSTVSFNNCTRLSNCNLPNGWSWADPSQLLRVGTQTYTACFSPDDRDKYEYDTLTMKLKITVTGDENYTPHIPSFTVKQNETLNDVPFPTYSFGHFEWENPDKTVKEIGKTTVMGYWVPKDTAIQPVPVVFTLTCISADSLLPTINNLTAHYDEALCDVRLPQNVCWKYPNKKIDSVGTQYYEALYTTKENEKLPITVCIDVQKAPAPELPAVKDFIVHYTPDMQLKDISLPENWTFNHPNDFIRVGSNSYQIIYHPQDSDIYNYQNVSRNVIIDCPPVIPDIPTNLGVIKVGMGDAKANYQLPEIDIRDNNASIGHYEWSTSGIFETSGTYKVIFVPDNPHYKKVETMAIVNVLPVDVKPAIPADNGDSTDKHDDINNVKPDTEHHEPHEPERDKGSSHNKDKDSEIILDHLIGKEIESEEKTGGRGHSLAESASEWLHKSDSVFVPEVAYASDLDSEAAKKGEIATEVHIVKDDGTTSVAKKEKEKAATLKIRPKKEKKDANDKKSDDEESKAITAQKEREINNKETAKKNAEDLLKSAKAEEQKRMNKNETKNKKDKTRRNILVISITGLMGLGYLVYKKKEQ